MWRFSILLLVACTEHGKGGFLPSDTLQTSSVFPNLCTSGEPSSGNPDCLPNIIPLQEFIPGATLIFVARPVGASMQLEDLTLHADGSSYVAVHPAVVSQSASGPTVHDAFPDLAVQVNAGTSVLLGTVDLGGFDATDRVFIQFDDLIPVL